MISKIYNMKFGVVFIVVLFSVLCAGCVKTDEVQREYNLSAPVQVVLDRCGVPHIFAENELDAFYVFGYLQAHFRLFQMDMSRREAMGRLAEIFPDALTQDIVQRALGIKKVAEDTVEMFQNIGITRKVQAFISGINRYIDDAKAGREWGGIRARIPKQYQILGVEPEYFAFKDIIAIGKKRSFDLSGGGFIDLATKLMQLMLGENFEEKFSLSAVEKVRVVPDFPKTRISPLGSDKAIFQFHNILNFPLNSNNFVISPTMTSVGYPILENDPHLSVSSPSTFFPFSIRSPEYSVKGFTFPSIPIALVGANDNICWGVTTTLIDSVDILFVPIKEENGRFFVQMGSKWFEANVVEEEILYRSGGELKSERIRFLQIPNLGFVLDHGNLDGFFSIIPSILGTPQEGIGKIASDILKRILMYPNFSQDMGIALIWTGYKPTSEIAAFYFLTEARDIFSAMKYYQFFQAGIQNFIVADILGNIGYFPAGEIPLRPAEVKPYLPDLSTKLFWIGFVPNDFNPRAVNPDSGYIVTANNDIVGQVFDNNPLNERFYLGPLYDIGFRAWRISSMIEQNRGFIDKVTAAWIVNDVFSGPAKTFLPIFFSIVSENDIRDFPVPQTIQQVMLYILERLKLWDLYSDVNSQGALLFEMVFKKFLADTVWNNFIKNYLSYKFKNILDVSLKGTEFQSLVTGIYDSISPSLFALLFSLISSENASYRFVYPVISGKWGDICVNKDVPKDDMRKLVLGDDLCPRDEFLRALSDTASYLLENSNLCKGGDFKNCVLGDFAGKRFEYIVDFPGSEEFEPKYKGSKYFRKSGGSLLVYASNINMIKLSTGEGGSVNPVFLQPDHTEDFVAFRQSGDQQTMKYICEAKPTGTRIHFVIPGGVADDPDSPYFSTMNEAWACAREWLKGITQGYCAIPPEFLPKVPDKESLFNIIFSELEDDFERLISGNYHAPLYCRNKEVYLVFR